MNKFNTYPTGYKITVTTWENDADNYKTQSIYGLTQEQIFLYVDLCKLFHQDNDCANLYDANEEEINYLDSKINEIKQKHHTVIEKHNLDVDGLLYDLNIFGEQNVTTRVVESVMIEFIPQDIVIEDITHQFFKIKKHKN